MNAIEIAGDLAALDAALADLPNVPAVFLLWPAEGQPYLSRTSLLRRRLLRLLQHREHPSRLLNLRHTIRRIEYQLTESSLESSIELYQQARTHFPETYLTVLKLRMPPYVKLALSKQFPRSLITTHLSRTPGQYFGPFRSRASAERFEAQFLDLFQIRRCQEDLIPASDHPGCMYGEMNMCLRPCQEIVGPSEYRAEVDRVGEFLRTGGQSLLVAIGHSRDRLSDEMLFEEAARQHKRYEKVQEVLKLRDELACDLDRLEGVAVTGSTMPEAVDLWFVLGGYPQPRHTFRFAVEEGRTISLDQKLREALAALEPYRPPARERQERLAILSRWYYSSWRDGEWLPFESLDEVPYRKLVNAISRVAHPDRQAR